MGSSFSAENDRTFTDPVENQKVVKMEKMSLPMDSTKGWLPHLGVKVTTDTGNEYMVHKAGKPGQDGRETATEVRHMSDPKIRPEEWQKSGLGPISVEGRNLKIGHFVEASGPGYNLIFDNSWNAADRMIDLRKPQWVRDFEWGEKYT